MIYCILSFLSPFSSLRFLDQGFYQKKCHQRTQGNNAYSRPDEETHLFLSPNGKLITGLTILHRPSMG